MAKHFDWIPSHEKGRTDRCDLCGDRAEGTTHYLNEAPVWHVCEPCQANHDRERGRA